MKRHERPTRRVNPSGEVVWMARYTDRYGKRKLARPDWNRGKGTFEYKRDAQDAIDEAHEREGKAPKQIDTVGGYLPLWLNKHPRSKRTDDTNKHRIKRVLDAEIEGRRLHDWPIHELRRRHVLELVDYMLREQGRAANGAKGILRSLSCLAEDAITDELADVNAFRGVKVRANDPRIQKEAKGPSVFTFAEMHKFAECATAPEAEHLTDAEREQVRRNRIACLRTFTDTGMRVGEVLPLRRSDLQQDDKLGWHFRVARTAHNGVIQAGTKTTHGDALPGRIVPVPSTLYELLAALPATLATDLLFPTLRGKLYWERNFARDVWEPARKKFGKHITRHDCRHSYVTHLSRLGIDKVDLGEVAGHTVQTMMGHYLHPTRESWEHMRKAIG